MFWFTWDAQSVLSRILECRPLLRWTGRSLAILGNEQKLLSAKQKTRSKTDVETHPITVKTGLYYSWLHIPWCHFISLFFSFTYFTCLDDNFWTIKLCIIIIILNHHCHHHSVTVTCYNHLTWTTLWMIMKKMKMLFMLLNEERGHSRDGSLQSSLLQRTMWQFSAKR